MARMLLVMATLLRVALALRMPLDIHRHVHRVCCDGLSRVDLLNINSNAALSYTRPATSPCVWCSGDTHYPAWKGTQCFEITPVPSWFCTEVYELRVLLTATCGGNTTTRHVLYSTNRTICAEGLNPITGAELEAYTEWQLRARRLQRSARSRELFLRDCVVWMITPLAVVYALIVAKVQVRALWMCRRRAYQKVSHA